MQANAGGTRVLIVDDEHAVADTLAIVFRMNGYDVQVAYSAEQAIETIAVWEPRLALLDVMLPGMNGIDFAVVLRDNHPDCQTLLFSGCESTGILLEEAAKRGHRFSILAKPAHPTEMLEAVKNLLAPGPRRVQDPG
ncbi:MAG: response regulator [Acidobacteriaceae bacterium]